MLTVGDLEKGRKLSTILYRIVFLWITFKYIISLLLNNSNLYSIRFFKEKSGVVYLKNIRKKTEREWLNREILNKENQWFV